MRQSTNKASLPAIYINQLFSYIQKSANEALHFVKISPVETKLYPSRFDLIFNEKFLIYIVIYVAMRHLVLNGKII